MTDQSEKFNPHMMVLAREARAMNQSQLAKAISVSQAKISKIESSVAPEPEGFVSLLSETLGFDSEFFYRTGRPYGMPPFHYRKRQKLGKKALEKIIADMNIRRIHVSIFARSYEFSANQNIPEIDRNELTPSGNEITAEVAARIVREMMLVPKGPIENMVELVEKMGGLIIPCEFNSDLIDAVSQRVDGLPVLFFVNMNAPADRIRWTLAHELGHMLLHTSSIMEESLMEEEADKFASALLLPADEIKPQLRQWSLRQVMLLKKYWKVSMAAIAMRAFDLGAITPHQKKSFFMQLGRLGMRKREPHEPVKEKPTLVKKMIDYHLKVLHYSEEDLAKSLFISVKEMREMYSPSKFATTTMQPLLRVVQ